MSIVEKVIIIALCILPIIALLIVLPKKLKGKNSNKKLVKESVKVEEKPKEALQSEQAEPKETKKEVLKSDTITADLLEDDSFKAYLKDKVGATPTPKPKITDLSGFGNFEDDLFDRAMGKPKPKEDKSLRNQIEELSPELKALLLSGALKPKHFEDDKDK